MPMSMPMIMFMRVSMPMRVTVGMVVPLVEYLDLDDVEYQINN